MSAAPRYVGIDVAKARLDPAARPSGDRWATANDAEGIAALVARLHELQPILVVLEATGGDLSSGRAGTSLPVVGDCGTLATRARSAAPSRDRRGRRCARVVAHDSRHSPDSRRGHEAGHEARIDQDGEGGGSMACAPLFVGIDVAVNRVGIAVRLGGERWSATNDADGVSACSSRCARPVNAVLARAGCP